MAAAVMFSLPSFMGTNTFGCCSQNCCASFAAAILGFMPVIMYRRSGGHATPGLGCVTGLISVAIGGVVGAIVQAKFPVYDVSQLRDVLGENYEEFDKAFQQQGQESPWTREEFISNGVTLAPYFVILVAAFSSFLAGVCGLLATAFGRRRQPPQQPPPNWPQQPPPPQV